MDTSSDAVTDPLRAQAVALRRAGVGARRIAAQLGIGTGRTRELLRGEPPPSTLRRPNAKDDLRELAVQLRERGQSYNDIQAELGVSKGSLSLWLRQVPRGAAGDADQVGCDDDEGALPDRELARALRREGWLLREIAAELAVSASAVHKWTRGIAIPPRASHGRSAQELAAMNRARWDATLAQRDLQRQQVISEAAASVRPLSGYELDLVAATAYWCEGTKSKPWQRRERVIFINSDPAIIRLWMMWLATRGIGPEQCRLSVSIHESADVARATTFWARIVGVDPSSFARPSLKRHNPLTVRKNTGEDYVGCLAISVRGGRTLYQEIEGIWAGIARSLI